MYGYYLWVVYPNQEAEFEKFLKGMSIPSPSQMLVDVQMEMFDPEPSLERITDAIVTDLGMKTVFSIINMLCLCSEANNEKLSDEQAAERYACDPKIGRAFFLPAQGAGRSGAGL